MGEGVQKDNHLYYRCTDRLYSFPQAPTCTAKGINAVVADSLVWKGLVEFMSDPERIANQLCRYFDAKKEKQQLQPTTRDQIENEIKDLGKMEDRYLKLYGNGRVSNDKLDKCLEEVKQRRYVLENELRSISDEKDWVMPSDTDIERFTAVVKEKLPALNYQDKRAILLKLVDKVVGDQNTLTVTGALSLGGQFTGYLDHRNMVYDSISRDSRSAECG